MTDQTTNPTPDAPDFDAEGVDDFADGEGFSGSMPGEQQPEAPQGSGDDGPDLDKILANVDMSDATADFAKGKKVKFTGTITGVQVWAPEDQPGRIVIKLIIAPTAPPICAKLGPQTVWCDIQAATNPEDAGKAAAGVLRGKAALRGFAANAGAPLSVDGKTLANGKSVKTLVGRETKGTINKGKVGDRVFCNP
mgnify:FL=1